MRDTKTVVIYYSRHQGNTEKIATEIGNVLNAQLLKPDAVDIPTIAENDLIGNFSCRGLDAVGPLKLIGGINKGRPNDEDLEAAAHFAGGLV